MFFGGAAESRFQKSALVADNRNTVARIVGKPGQARFKVGTGELPHYVLILIRRWGLLWGVPHLGDRLQVNLSTRLRRSLGRCRPREGRITLRADLRRSPAELAEVLCHELAHVAGSAPLT